MEHREAQLHQEIIHTRQAIDHKLAQLERRVQQIVYGMRSTATDVIDYGIVANVQRARETRDRGVAVLARYPWLIIAGGALLGYLLVLSNGAQRLHAPSGGVRVYEGAPGCPPVTQA